MGYVYVIGNGRGYYKIGQTDKQVEKRLAALQIGSPDPLSIVHVISHINQARIERELHEKFMAKRVRGEWFKLDRSDLLTLTGGRQLPVTWPLLVELEPKLGELWMRARLEWAEEPAEYCSVRIWYGYGKDGEKVGLAYSKDGRGHGLKSLICDLVGWSVKHRGGNPVLASSEAYDIAYETVLDALPSCRGRCGCNC